jgi:hypothetical protein
MIAVSVESMLLHVPYFVPQGNIFALPPPTENRRIAGEMVALPD